MLEIGNEDLRLDKKKGEGNFTQQELATLLGWHL